MRIKEYRIPMPLTIEEYQRGQLYSIAEASKRETGGGEGIEVVKNETFKNQVLGDGKPYSGIYTYKVYHLQSKVPPFIRLLAPKGSLQLHEEAWNAYPYCKTILSNPHFMKEKFYIIIESIHLPDNGNSDNPLRLTGEPLKQRKIVLIDIANDPILPEDYKSTGDPTKFRSTATGRGPLFGKWIDSSNPIMTAYKLVTVEFKWFGLQKKIETFIHKSEKRIFFTFHRNMFCWIDKWHSMTMRDIKAHEEKTKEELDKMRNTGKVRGMVANADDKDED